MFCSAPGGGYNPLFSIEDDKALGQQLEQEIANNPQEYPILDRSQYPSAYGYLERMKDEILSSGKVVYAEQFDWKLYIVQDDQTLNAFCAPGGYIYVYTGLIKYLDNASSLAGVLGHEMAHADERHSVNQMSKMYGIEILTQVALGQNSSEAVNISKALVGLKFSRSDESEADKRSVEYLCNTKYHHDGTAQFFIKMQEEGGEQPPEFLSTHPSHENRIQEIKDYASTITGCKAKLSEQENTQGYQAFQRMLPQ
jgi:predicted Zn-dependent protease